MRISKAMWWSAFLLAAVIGGPSCLAQDIQDDFTNLTAEYGTARLFPSLLPVSFLQMSYFPYRQSMSQDPNSKGEELAFPATSTAPGQTPWIIIRKGSNDPENGTDILNQVQRIDLQSIPGMAYFYFRPGTLRQGDHLQVGLLTRDKKSRIGKKFHSSVFGSKTAEELEVSEEPSSYTLNLDPRTVADQELIDGTSKTVHQLGLNLDVPSFGFRRLGNFYFHTENVLSTDREDVSAQADLRLGFERSLLRTWYVPANLETRYVTNQASTNRSLILSGGFRTFIPWGFAHRFESRPIKRGGNAAGVQNESDFEVVHSGLLWNNLVKSPLAPELRLSLQYEDRLELDPVISDVHAAEKVGRVETLFELNPIYLLARGKPTPNDIVLSVRAKGWWFLNEESLPAASARNFESNIETDISIPLSRLQMGGLNSSVAEEKKLQIRYRSGANEANSFIRSSEWSIGFNILR